MAKLSDVIENFIKASLKKGGRDELQIRRNELADKFSCAPSQINYVLTTRFTYERGYVIESRRGGGGYIIIKKVSHHTIEERNKIISEIIGNSITYHNALALLENLYEDEIINEHSIGLIKITLNDRTLQNTEDKNRIRADILKAMIMVLIK